MNKEFFDALDVLEKEKGIPKDYMLEKVEAALISAFKREMGGAANVRILLDPAKKDMKIFQQRTVVEEVTDPQCEISLEAAKAISRRHKLGGIVENKLDPKEFRRLSAQAAKQVIIQAIREAERNNMAREYENKREEIITATVDKIDENSGAVILNMGNGYASLQKSEQIPGETFRVGDKIKVFVTEVHSPDSRGPLVTLSRVHHGLIRRLFELQIPEIQDGTVLIKSVSREAGSRTKIAVWSRDENVDPVGACIGNRGMRIESILGEFKNEKIDVIRYSEDMCQFVAAALAPAKVLKVEMDGERSCRVTVDADQLSLAIGKEGQNAKLAARLTGCKIDIKA
ncbi:MAG: transcription termination/antitermination protein NusA [Clostridia bacterium]|nr:transcription termination/antitermination protein NusA [Clostridia bacterium]